jgi:hypothetical protein
MRCTFRPDDHASVRTLGGGIGIGIEADLHTDSDPDTGPEAQIPQLRSIVMCSGVPREA